MAVRRSAPRCARRGGTRSSAGRRPTDAQPAPLVMAMIPPSTSTSDPVMNDAPTDASSLSVMQQAFLVTPHFRRPPRERTDSIESDGELGLNGSRSPVDGTNSSRRQDGFSGNPDVA